MQTFKLIAFLKLYHNLFKLTNFVCFLRKDIEQLKKFGQRTFLFKKNIYNSFYFKSIKAGQNSKTMPWNFFIMIDGRIYRVKLQTLTIESLRQQIIEVTKEDQQNNELIRVCDRNESDITTDEHLKIVAKEQIALTAYFQPSFTLLYFFSNEKCLYFSNNKKNMDRISIKRKVSENRTFILCRAIKYEKRPYLERAKQDLHLLQELFEQRFGYEVLNTFHPQRPNTELLTLKGLNKFLLKHCWKLTDIPISTFYDGLILVWCGHGYGDGANDRDSILITSDEKEKNFKDIQDEFVIKTSYFVGKPKIFMHITYREEEEEKKNQSNIRYNHNADIFTIFANASANVIVNKPENEIDKKGIHFTQIFCQMVENIIDKNFDFIAEQVTKLVSGQIVAKEEVQTDSNVHSNLYLIPRPEDRRVNNSDNNDSNDNDTLPDFRKHWNKDWKKANAEAAKLVEKMKSNEQGVIVVAKHTSQWQDTRNPSSFISLVYKNKADKQQFGEYWMYVIKGNVVLLDNVDIDGNLYAIGCEIQCRGNVNITMELFVTTNTIIDEKLKRSILPVQWKTHLHHDVPVQLQDLKDNARKCFGNSSYEEAIKHFLLALELSIENFEFDHPHIADAYNNLGLGYARRGKYDKALECHEKSLRISLDIFGTNHNDVADSYYSLGNIYDSKQQYDKAIEYYGKSLKILKSFGNSNRLVGDLCWNLGLTFEKMLENKTAHEYYEESWKSYSILLGDWNEETLASKRKTKLLSS
ncbi:hypothetical protein RFI_06660 [Reticulomyxa filosa]|uniref:Uncharacterized protein n=1 Tax=Reticulomyxa filosa TaxID=46433 RepID=X6NWW2_RETFI|nr:hypothetical protein RFI_06660 [Reticulomyxa filosa]|eukprot:ETO30461.1 hypothetical protein RFI_06660 [Reticulomyxa filosa]